MSPMSLAEFVDVLMKGSVCQAQSTNQHVDPMSLTGNALSQQRVELVNMQHIFKGDNYVF